MVSENLNIDIDVSGNFSEKLTQLSLQLKEVAAAQSMVDEKMRIDVDTSGLSAAKRQLSGLGGGDGGGSSPIAMTSGGQRRGGGIAPNLGMLFTQHLFRDISDLGDESQSLRGSFRQLRRTVRQGDGLFGNLNLRMTQFYDVLASLLPLLLTFVGAIPAILTALGALTAAALGAAAGLAAIGGMAFLGLADSRAGSITEGLQDIIGQIRESFLDAFAPLMERFTPLARDALEGLEDLFDAIAAQGHVLTQLRDDARALGGFLLEFLPGLVVELGRVAEAFMPLFSAFGEWAKGADLIRGFSDVARRATGSMMNLTAAFLGILPLIVDMSLGFLHVSSAIMTALTGFTRLLGIFSPLLNLFGLTGETLGSLAGTFLVLTSVLAVAIKVKLIWAAVLQGSVATALANAITNLHAYIAAEIGALNATIALTAATAALLGILTFGIAPILGSITSQWFGVKDAIDETTSSLKDFNRISGNSDAFGGGSLGPVGRGAQTGVVQNNTTVVYEGSPDEDESWETANRTAFVNKTTSPTQ